MKPIFKLALLIAGAASAVGATLLMWDEEKVINKGKEKEKEKEGKVKEKGVDEVKG